VSVNVVVMFPPPAQGTVAAAAAWRWLEANAWTAKVCTLRGWARALAAPTRVPTNPSLAVPAASAAFTEDIVNRATALALLEVIDSGVLGPDPLSVEPPPPPPHAAMDVAMAMPSRVRAVKARERDVNEDVDMEVFPGLE
jgi:hypothetical protein